MIHLRPPAAQELRRLLSRSGQEKSAQDRSGQELRVRLSLEPGTCAEWIYQLNFGSPVQANEQVFDCEGIAVTVPDHILPYVQNLTIDYAEDLMGGGFRFVNPQAVHTCGCGNAFSLRAESSERADAISEADCSHPVILDES